MNIRAVWILTSVWLGWAILGSPMWSQAPELLLPVVAIAVLTLRPILIWMKTGGYRIPILEIFCLLHGVYYLLPALGGREDLLAYSIETRFQALCAVALFLLAVQIAGSWFKLEKPLLTGPWSWLAKRELSIWRAMPVCWTLLLVWVGFEVLKFLTWLPDLGGLFQPLDTIIGALGLLAVYYLGQAWGQGQLDLQRKLMFFGCLSVWITFNLATGFLVVTATVILLLLCSYVMATHQLPIAAALAACVLMAFLSLGKYEMRQQFWRPAAVTSSQRPSPLQILGMWLNASWENLNSPATNNRGSGVPSVLDRTSLLQILMLTIQETPNQRPYLQGQTYAQTLTILVPRFLWPEKPRGTLPSETVAIYYGLQTQESAKSTAIAIGQIAESWANFGWWGILGAGIAMGGLLSIPARLSAFGMPNQARVFLAIATMTQAVDLEHSLGQWLVILINYSLVASVVIFLVCRKVRTPQIPSGLHSKSVGSRSVPVFGSAHR